MTPIKLDGKLLADCIMDQIADQLSKVSLKPTLAVIRVGNDDASNVYINSKKKDCKKCGVDFKEYTFDVDVNIHELSALIEKLNMDVNVRGILIERPLPKTIDEAWIMSRINPMKDVDSLSNNNIGQTARGEELITPCTPTGIMLLLKAHNINLIGKHCVIVGRSSSVGRPLMSMLINRHATVTCCHSHTENIEQITRHADIVISAVGKPNFITADMVREGAILIDVGINRDSDGKLCGDISKEAIEKSSYYTPVPGGVGPMTRAALMGNIALSTYCVCDRPK